MTVALELMLWVVAVSCLGSIAGAAVIAWHASRAAAQVHHSAQVASAINYPPAQSKVPPGAVIGRVEIPALKLSVPITDGIETDSLLKGVGHIDGTALPGGLGTVGLAGHRDTYLRPLERVAAGMDIRLVIKTGIYHYRVDRWEVVLPENVSVLAIASRPELALITCYPFHYVGPAPKRFVLYAHLVSVSPDR